MSPTLKINIERDFVGDEVAGAAVANIYAYGPRGARDTTRDRRGLVIPAGRKEHLDVDVPIGRYLVEAKLPSGEVLSKDVRVGEGQVAVVSLQGTPSPYEWLGFQQLLGNVPPPAPARVPARRRLTGAVPRNAVAGGHREPAGRAARVDGVEAPRPSPKASPSSRDHRSRAATLRWIDQPVLALAGPDRGAAAWGLIANVVGQPDPLLSLAGTKQTKPRTLTPAMRDDRVQLYAMGPGGPVGLGDNNFGPGNPTPRQYVLADSEAGCELGILPTPWPSLTNGDTLPLEILIDRTVLPGAFALAITPRDPNVASALGYMSNGSFQAAKDVFGQAREMLYGKMISPLAAAAGGYVLLATETTNEPSDWHRWVGNLHAWFDWLPDGAILYGRLRLRHRRSDQDVAAASDALKTAFNRGLPYYSLGLQWLVEGLSMLASRDKDAARMLDQVRAVSWQVNPRQTFTTLRISRQ